MFLENISISICVVYMDDILVFRTEIENHHNNFRTIFKAQRKANSKLQIHKCFSI